jgi:bifunctional non-homologous end joining protein LigD
MAKAGKARLGKYEDKRDFEFTSEPAPKKPKPTSKKRRRKKGAPRFVVQEHSARRLHWDLRLEHDGVAVSWAIPNGVPMDPSENRKAVHTEDHPLEYLEFEGEIPPGQYGAGTMRIWDRGTYELHKWQPGKVIVSFEGERLSGRYALFRAGAGEKDWMIHRMDPPAQPRDPFPESVVPMLAKLSTLPASDDGWAAEVKWDGVRAIAYCRPGRLELQTRNLNDVTKQYPEVRRLSRQLGAREAVLDGELVAFDEQGRPSFERLQQRIHQTSESVVRRRMKSHPVVYVIFDLLYLGGRNLIDEPYSRRRELLAGLELAGESWQTPDYSTGHAEELLAASAERGLEGIVLKRLESRYAPGKRSGAWLKVKNLGRQEFVIGGWQEGEGRRRNRLGAILLGYFDGGEGELRYAGKVGTGFSERDLDQLTERLRPLARKSNPFAGKRGPRDAHFVAPKLVAEIEFREMTADGMVRHGSFKGLREDKPATEVGVELPVPPEGDSIEWYSQMAEVLLPHLHGRLLTEDQTGIEQHVSLSLAEEVERPTAVVFDLDPSASADLLDCAQVALWIRGMFEQLGLNCYPKTSGSKGMQVYVPLNTDVTYRETKPFAKAVAETLEGKFPDRVTSQRSKDKRRGKVLVDWSLNDQRKTTLCVYSLRAEEPPTVSTPLEWDEVEAALGAEDGSRLVFGPAEALVRIEEKGDLFAPVLSEAQRLP